MATVIRQDIYEDLKPQDKNQDWCGVSLCVGRFSCMLGNSEGPWEGLAAGDRCGGSEGSPGDPCEGAANALPMACGGNAASARYMDNVGDRNAESSVG